MRTATIDDPAPTDVSPTKSWKRAPYLSLTVLVSACSIFGGAGSSSSTIPLPGAGQWVDFGRNKPPISNGAFTFPGPSGVAGYFYTKPPATMARDQTVTLVYSIDGSAPVWAVSDPTDAPPATMHLFLWRSMTCRAMAQWHLIVFGRHQAARLSSATVRR